MAVRCDGDAWIIERLGEKQDFESELSRLGFSHEEFILHVRRAGLGGVDRTWASNYAVRVTNARSRKRNVYWGGPGENWVEQFVADVAQGIWGEATRRYARPVAPVGRLVSPGSGRR